MQEAVTSSNLPKPGGPYSPAVAWERLVFVSGQGPVDAEGNSGAQMDIADQVSQTLANLESVLQASGSDRTKVLSVQAYLTDLADFAVFNSRYAEFFAGCVAPARTTVQVAALPNGIAVELNAIAYRAS